MTERNHKPRIAVLDLLLTETRAAMQRAERPRQPSRMRRLWPAVAIGAVLLVGGAATATDIIIGDDLPAPPAGDRPADQVPAPGTSTVEAVRSADPYGGAPWGVRVSRNKEGALCVAVGRIHQGRLGVQDGRVFRALPEGGPDVCNPVPSKADPLRYEITQDFGVRSEGPRTIIAGLAHPDVRAIAVETPAGGKPLEVSDRGAFVAVFKGQLHPRELPLTAELADGSRERYSAPGVR